MNTTPYVLVVDDEAVVRDVLRRYLVKAEVKVLLAGNGQEAIELYRLYHSRISAVVLDLQMPGIDGLQTMQGLRAIHPDVRCFLMSGSLWRYHPNELKACGAEGIFAKPFRNPRDLVNAVLDAVRTCKS